MRLALSLLINEFDFTFYLDNLFTSVPLAQALKEASIGMTGTTRKNSKGIPQWMLDMKGKNREFIWDSACGKACGGRKLSQCKEGETPKDPDVLVFLWQDNNSVIGKIPGNTPVNPYLFKLLRCLPVDRCPLRKWTVINNTTLLFTFLPYHISRCPPPLDLGEWVPSLLLYDRLNITNWCSPISDVHRAFHSPTQ